MSNILQKLWDLITNEIEPALAGFFSKAEPEIIEALTPIFNSVITQEQAALTASAGDPVKFAEASAVILTKAAASAVEAGIEATGAALLQVLTAAVAAIEPPTVTVTVAAPTTPAPTPAPAPTEA